MQPAPDAGAILLIRKHLADISNSAAFSQSRRLQEFLQFLVEAAIRGESGQLKEAVIASEVYGRGPDFDPKLDSIVRTEASRLRRKLDEYYTVRGLDDPVRFELPKGGYSLRIELRNRTVLAEPPPPVPVPVPKLRGRTLAVASCAILLVAALSWLIITYGIPKPTPPAVFTVLTSYPGFQLHPSLSPDGKYVAFSWNGDGDNYDIYVKAIDEETPRRLTTDPADDLSPTWSPDGTQIAFLRASGSKNEIFVVPSAGGPERKIADLNPVSTPWVQQASIKRRLIGPAWSPRGQYLAVVDRCTVEGRLSDCVYLLSIDGVERRRISAGAEVGDYGPAFSPDGQQLAFLRTVARSGLGEVYVQRLAGESARRLTQDERSASAVAWSTDHRVYYVCDRTAENLLWSIPESGGEPRLVTDSGRAVSYVSAAIGVNRIAYAAGYRNTNIWRTNLAAPGTPSTLFISSDRGAHSPQYSPDGKEIVFVSDRTGRPELWISKSDGTNQRRLTFSSAYRPIGSPNFSPDGKLIACDSVTSTDAQIYLLNADGTNMHRFTTDPWNEVMPTWSRDGQWLYYISRHGGDRTLWKRSLDGAKTVHIANGVFTDALETPDGKRVIFAKAPSGVWEASVDGGDERPIPELADVGQTRHAFMDAKGMYIVPQQQPPWQACYFDFATRRLTIAAHFDKTPEFYTRSLSVSPDGQWLLHAQVDKNGSEIYLIQ